MTNKLSLNLINETKLAVAEELFSKVISRIVSRLRPVKAVGTLEVEIVLVGDRKIERLNQQYLGKNYPTDVISFPASDDSVKEGGLLGSIVISVDTAARQAKQAGITVDKELEMLTGHGLLHLLGFHHR
jgi:probable rRNA maturation factor